MSKPNIILVLFHFSWDLGTDYVRKISLELSKNSTVVIWNPFNPTIKNLISGKNSLKSWLSPYSDKFAYYVPSVCLVPFHRINIIYYLNFFLNYIFFIFVYLIKFGIRKPVIWFFTPEYARIYKFFTFRKFTIYDRPDHYSSIDSSEDKELKKYDRLAILNSTIAVTNSPYALRYIKKFNNKSFLSPWGCDGELLSGVKKQLRTGELDIIPRPRIGIIGYINHRYKLKLIYDLALKNPKWNFIFIGKLYEYSGKQALLTNFKYYWNKLIKLSNVYYLGERQKEYINEYILKMDIGLIPYDTSQEFVKGCNPMKTYEFLAQGKTVVSTDIEALKDLYPWVKIAHNPNQMQNLIRKAIRPVSINQSQGCRLIAKQNTWKMHVDVINRYVDREISNNYY